MRHRSDRHQDGHERDDRAGAKLIQDGYTDPTIGPSPEGYKGYALRHGSKVNVTIDKLGVTPTPGAGDCRLAETDRAFCFLATR